MRRCPCLIVYPRVVFASLSACCENKCKYNGPGEPELTCPSIARPAILFDGVFSDLFRRECNYVANSSALVIGAIMSLTLATCGHVGGIIKDSKSGANTRLASLPSNHNYPTTVLPVLMFGVGLFDFTLIPASFV